MMVGVSNQPATEDPRVIRTRTTVLNAATDQHVLAGHAMQHRRAFATSAPDVDDDSVGSDSDSRRAGWEV